MCKFYYEYAKNKLHPKLLFTNTDSLVYELREKMFMKFLIQIDICLILLIIQ